MKSWAGAAAAIVVGLSATQAFAQAGNAARGERVFNQQCKTCHSLEDGSSLTGPTLHGMFGRKAGTVAGFAYSGSMKNSGVTWDQSSLDKFIGNPDSVVPNSKMKPYTGIADAATRKQIIEFLKTNPD